MQNGKNSEKYRKELDTIIFQDSEIRNILKTIQKECIPDQLDLVQLELIEIIRAYMNYILIYKLPLFPRNENMISIVSDRPRSTKNMLPYNSELKNLIDEGKFSLERDNPKLLQFSNEVLLSLKLVKGRMEKIYESKGKYIAGRKNNVNEIMAKIKIFPFSKTWYEMCEYLEKEYSRKTIYNALTSLIPSQKN